MKFGEFVEKLEQYKEEYRSSTGRELKTVRELEAFLSDKKTGQRRGAALKSLKGLNI